MVTNMEIIRVLPIGSRTGPEVDQELYAVPGIEPACLTFLFIIPASSTRISECGRFLEYSHTPTLEVPSTRADVSTNISEGTHLHAAQKYWIVHTET